MSNKYSLHIGIQEYSKTQYPDGINRLNYCIKDMEAMANLAINSGFNKEQVYFLKNGEATAGAVEDKIKMIAKNMEQSGGLFLFTFAGHGVQRLDTSVDERDGMDECICLYDGPLYDDDVFNLLNNFSKKCTIICFFDSCHSGTVHKAFAPPGEIRGLNDEERLGMYWRNLGQFIGKKIKYNILNTDKRIKAYGASFAACRDQDSAYEFAGHGYFTNSILKILEEQKFKGTYDQLFQQLSKQLYGIQEPTLSPLFSLHPELAFNLDEEMFPISII